MSSTMETGDKEKEAGGHNQRPEDREEDEDSKQERKKERKHKHSKHSSRHRSSSRDRKRKKHRHHDEEDDGKREKARGMLPSSGEAIERERGEKREGGRRDRSRERYSHRDSDRDRERGRSRDDRERGRSGDRLRERERDERGRERRSSRSQERRRSLGRDEERRGREKEPEKKGLTLKDIMEANPGISMAEAVQRFHAHNVAQAGDEGVSEATIALRSQFIANINASTGIVGVGGAATKPFREIYVGNLPPAVTVPQLIDFLNSAMRALGTTSPRGSVVNAWLSMDGHYAFCELSTIEECNAALSYLNLFQVGSAQLRIGRPSGFKPVPGMSTSTGTMGVGPGGLSKLSGLLGGVPFSGGLGSVYTPLTGASASDSSADANADHSNVVILNNLPLGLDKEQIRELVSAFGDLSAFNVIRDPLEDSQSAVFKYAVETIAEQAISGLGELTLGDQKLSAQLVPTNMVDILLQPADISRNDAIAIESKEGSAEIKVEEMPWSRDKIILRSHPPSRVLCFYGMTAEDDLKLDDYFDEMVEDIAQEFNTCAAVSSIEVPRTGEAKGLVFIYLASIEGAVKCRRELEGRTFNGNETSAVYFPEDFFLQRKFLLPAGYTLPKQKPEDDID